MAASLPHVLEVSPLCKPEETAFWKLCAVLLALQFLSEPLTRIDWVPIPSTYYRYSIQEDAADRKFNTPYASMATLDARGDEYNKLHFCASVLLYRNGSRLELCANRMNLAGFGTSSYSTLSVEGLSNMLSISASRQTQR